jgi:hypothetical protein
MSAAAAALAARWRAEADTIRRYDARLAEVAAMHAAELEAAVAADHAAELTMVQAVEESGYSERRLRQMLASGELPNAGQPGRPRIRRSDLPRKPKTTDGSSPYDPAADARRLLSG